MYIYIYIHIYIYIYMNKLASAPRATKISVCTQHVS